MTTTHGSNQADRFALASDVFRRSWSLYEKLVIENYMRHREMEQLLHGLLLELTGPFALLDLGCGDAAMVARALQGTRAQRYTGVELVDAAARLAEQRLQEIVPDRSFLIGNLIDAVRRPWPEKFDVVLASYSVHHLSLAEKARLFHDVKACLKSGGRFILIDLMLKAEENRQDYLDRFYAFAARSFSVLTGEEQRNVRDHMQGSDWPESQATYTQLAQEAGLGNIQLRYRDPEEFYALLTMDAVGPGD